MLYVVGQLALGGFIGLAWCVGKDVAVEAWDAYRTKRAKAKVAK